MLISLDVTALFTNISVELVKTGIEKRFHRIMKHTPIQLDELLEVIGTLMVSTFYEFNGNYYQQFFGTTMGSLVSPISADITMDDLETNFVTKLKMDDIIICIPKDTLDMLFSSFNSYYERLQFTYELDSNNRIRFLDLVLIREENLIVTD